MHKTAIYELKIDLKFSPFDLFRLLKTVFNPQKMKKCYQLRIFKK
ncbi:hypothetical protein DB44_BG01390 [Candidatus Protochlamydia amoebophila]|uniref:Uncharacterized protein n=1 Tax=Candidatus Protochlamydia amoebophila TaxID=362787 RepID=A0A0C1H7N4_9BACT|nr:hypothetical protein DB44_BG01390 [Candidatus Protochlamydia amoebophila]